MYDYWILAQSRSSKSRIDFLKLLNDADEKCNKNSTLNLLVVYEPVEKIKINSYHRK